MKTTQTQRILQYLEDFGSITTYQAFIDLGITRLASRICDLAQQGYEFDKNFESGTNRYGDNVSYCRYKLKKENAVER